MKSEAFDFISNLSTVSAMVAGAVLATVGGFVTSQLEWQLEKRRRQRQAALLFGEVFSTLGSILDLAHGMHGRGDPFGPVTMRMLRSAKSELEIYSRNRETLYDLHDASLRARIHALILRINAPLEGVFDTTEELQLVATQLRTPDLPAEHRDELEARRERLVRNRDGGYDFLMDNTQQLAPLVRELEVLSGRKISASTTLSRGVTD